MSQVLHIIGLLLVVLGLIFIIIGSIGVVRLPDFFARTHAASKVDTVGISVVALGVAFMEGATIIGLKVLLVALFVMLTNPVAAHALARAALHSGVKPWVRPETKTKTETEN